MHGSSPFEKGTAAAIPLWLWTFASGSFALGTVLGSSYSNRIVFNRYSPLWFTLICASLLCFAILAATAVRTTLSQARQGPASRRRPSRYSILLALAAASWGASLLSQYWVDPQHISRLFAGEFFGATQTAGVLLEYLAQVFAVLAVMLFLVTRALRASVSQGRVLSRVPLVVAALLGAYLIAEGNVRLLNVTQPRTQSEPTKPSRIFHQRYDSLNSHGYRDREFERRTDGKELRILVIGDSFTYGTGIRNPGDRFTAVLERRLSSNSGVQSVQVFNAGKPGANSADHLRMLNELLWLDPDVVILAYVFNDIEHLIPVGATAFNPPTYFARFGMQRVLMLNSHMFDQLFHRYRRHFLRRQYSGEFDRLLIGYMDPKLLHRHLNLLARVVERTRAAGATFHLVPFDPAVGVGLAYAERYERFVRAAVDRGIPVWSLRSLFDAVQYDALIVNGWDHHPNERANRLVGDFLAGRIASDEKLFLRPGD